MSNWSDKSIRNSSKIDAFGDVKTYILTTVILNNYWGMRAKSSFFPTFALLSGFCGLPNFFLEKNENFIRQFHIFGSLGWSGA